MQTIIKIEDLLSTEKLWKYMGTASHLENIQRREIIGDKGRMTDFGIMIITDLPWYLLGCLGFNTLKGLKTWARGKG